MRIICNKKGNNVSISINTEYEVLRETPKRYSIINDKGIEKNYCKSLFSIVQHEEELINEPIIPVIDFDELDINIETNIEDEIITSTIIATGTNNFKFIKAIPLNLNDTLISCGILQLTGVNEILRVINDFKIELFNKLNLLENTNLHITEEDITQGEILEGLINNIIDVISNEDLAGMIILSTNITNNNLITEEYITIFDKMSSTVLETLNPNSKNRIKMWTLQITE